MSAITVRGLSEETRQGLRREAAARGVSVEALARDRLAALAAGEDSVAPKAAPTGMAEQSMPWPMPAPAQAASFDQLHGALAGRIHIETDLTLPTGEIWDAQAGTS